MNEQSNTRFMALEPEADDATLSYPRSTPLKCLPSSTAC